MRARKGEKKLPPGQTPIKKLLRWGTDHATIGGAIPKIDLKKWNLSVEGEVREKLKLSWDDILKLPRTQHAGDFHCVEGWSVLNLKWEGVLFKHLAQLAKPLGTAAFVTFECADRYTTSLPLQALMKDGLLAYMLNGEFLEEGIGAPLRLVIPDRYAYKNAMWIVKVKFTSERELGYWEKRGYSDTANVWENDRFSVKKG